MENVYRQPGPTMSLRDCTDLQPASPYMAKKNAITKTANRVQTVATVVATVGKIASVVAGAAGVVGSVAETMTDAGNSVNKSVVKPVKRALGISKARPAKKASPKPTAKKVAPKAAPKKATKKK